MTREKITTCHVAGCGRNTTLYRRHCITVHDMTDYIYKFFLALSQSWDKEFTYNYNDDFMCFNDDTNDNLLLKLCLPSNKRRPRPPLVSQRPPLRVWRNITSTGSFKISITFYKIFTAFNISNSYSILNTKTYPLSSILSSWSSATGRHVQLSIWISSWNPRLPAFSSHGTRC